MSTTPHTAALRAAQTTLVVDEKAGTIGGCAVMTAGPWTGWGVLADEKTIQQCADLINAKKNGVKARFRHSQNMGTAEALGTEVGYLKNARVEGSVCRADLEFGTWASSLPGLGDVRGYLLKKAMADPTGLGLSAVLRYGKETVMDPSGSLTAVAARLMELIAVDFVENPAANPNGLLSADAAGSFAAAAVRNKKQLNLTINLVR